MGKLPVISAKKLVRILSKNGYTILRQKGGHAFLYSQEYNKGTTIPIHGGEDLGKGILKSILNDLELKVDELLEMME
jgi:predicted RNA binding protein YcfA (HicA-like mRNA interferase family)